MDFTKILWRLQTPIFYCYAIPLDEKGRLRLYLVVLEDLKGNSFLLHEWLEVDEKFRTNSLAQLYKIKSGFEKYTRGHMPKEYSHDYFQSTEKKEGEKTYKSLQCIFPDINKPIYIKELDVAGIIKGWDLALKGRISIYLMDSSIIFSLSRPHYYALDKIPNDMIEKFGKTYDLISGNYANEDVKSMFQKHIFDTFSGQKVLEKYKKLPQNRLIK